MKDNMHNCTDARIAMAPESRWCMSDACCASVDAGLHAGAARRRRCRCCPPLDVPAPPPRIVLPIETEVEAAGAAQPVPEEPRRAQPAPPRPRRPRRPKRPARRAAASDRSAADAACDAPGARRRLQTTPACRAGRGRARDSRDDDARDGRAQPDRLPRAQRRCADAVRHGQAIHPAGRRRDPDEEPSVCEKSCRQGGRAGGSAKRQ